MLESRLSILVGAQSVLVAELRTELSWFILGERPSVSFCGVSSGTLCLFWRRLLQPAAFPLGGTPASTRGLEGGCADRSEDSSPSATDVLKPDFVQGFRRLEFASRSPPASVW